MNQFHRDMVVKYGLPNWLPEGWTYKPAGKNKKPVEGIGINDVEFACQPSIAGKQVRYKLYKTWHAMLTRGFNQTTKINRPTYKDASVDSDWLYFSNFLTWALPKYIDGYVLDKDIKYRDNKIYSADTCLFVPPNINTFVLTNRGDLEDHSLALGVSLINSKCFCARIKDPFTNKRKHLGVFSTEIEAHNAWRLQKITYGRQLSTKFNIPELNLAIDRLELDMVQNINTISI